MTEPNLLCYGNYLDVLRRQGVTDSVELVYFDPPFNSKATHSVLFEEHGKGAAPQVMAFGDTWQSNATASKLVLV